MNPAQSKKQPRTRPKPTFTPHHFPKPTDYRAAGKLLGKVALITGGDCGIGRAVAVLFAREGAASAIVYLPYEQGDAEATRRAVEEAGGKLLLIPGDVTDTDFCREAVNTTIVTYGRLDILVNTTAKQQHRARLEDVSDEQWDRTFKTNIYGYFHMAKEVLPYLRRGAAIINTISTAGLEGSKQLLDESATKGAVRAFTKSLAQNLIERGIRVNCIAVAATVRPIQAEEIAPAFVFLASEADSGTITGEILSSDTSLPSSHPPPSQTRPQSSHSST